MKSANVIKGAEQAIREHLIQGGNSDIEQRIGFAVEQALRWVRLERDEAPLEISRIQAKLLTDEVAAKVRNTRDAT